MELNSKLQSKAVRRQALKGRWFHTLESFENNAKECGFYSVASGAGHSRRKPELTRSELSARGLCTTGLDRAEWREREFWG